MSYKWKPNKQQIAAFKNKLQEQDKALSELQSKYKDWCIYYNDNKSSLYMSNSKLKVEYRISTHHLPNKNYGDTNKYRNYKGDGLNNYKKIEIITNSRYRVLEKAREVLNDSSSNI